MKSLLYAQELAHRFNEDESVWRRFQEKRLGRDSASLFADELLDEIDWREAEQENHVAKCVGKPLTSRSNQTCARRAVTSTY